MSEKAMFVLAARLGKQTAYEVLYNASMAPVKKGKDIVTTLQTCPEVQKVLSDETIRDLFDPTTYVGLCAKLAREAAKEDWAGSGD
jgi:adenylosuccinate lyase